MYSTPTGVLTLLTMDELPRHITELNALMVCELFPLNLRLGSSLGSLGELESYSLPTNSGEFVRYGLQVESQENQIFHS